jgi:hypothetical protein
MKHSVLFSLSLVFTLELYASQEIQRIDSIVNDIAALRKEYKEKLLDEKEKNIILTQKNKTYKRKISNLENEIKRLNILLKNRKNSSKNQVVVPVCKEENPFPKLKLKENVPVQHFKATAFRFTKTADIYAGVSSSQVIGRWDEGTSFTSNAKTRTRVKITGYFVNKVWTKAEKEMWVELSDVTQKF